MIDAHGNTHARSGNQAGGQLTSRRNPAPAGALIGSAAPDRDEVHAAATGLGRIGTGGPDEGARLVLWWSIGFGRGGNVRPAQDIREQLAALDEYGEDPAQAELVASSTRALQWLLGDADTPIA